MLNRNYLLLILMSAMSGSALGDVGHGHGSSVGTLADPNDATRTVEIVMTDNRYDHETIDIHNGDIVRFIVHNKGQLVHEFNVGTREMHTAHQGEMLTMMQSGKITPTKMKHGHGGTMGHDDPNSVLLNPGETRELVWKFSQAGDGLEFACNVPGHYQAGMVGRFHVKAN